MKSYWIGTTEKKENYDILEKNIETDVCIIGGGITGISIAYKLLESKLNIALVEKGQIGMQTTGNSTAKITNQHGLFYKYLSDSKGKDFAKKYYEANENAIKDISNIIKKENINCEFEKQPAYVFAQKEEDVQKIKDEVDIVNSFGGDAEYVDGKSMNNELLKLKPLAAIKFKEQAQFNSYKYVLELAKICKNAGVEIYENTIATEVENEGDYYKIETENGNIIKSKYLVIATKYPIINMPGFYFMKMYQSTSYGIAIKVKEKLFDGMYISTCNPKISLRMAQNGDEYVLIVVGEDHKTGENTDLQYPYEKLENIAKQLYPDGKIEYCWSTEDCISLDKIPYIGRYSTIWENAYVATGFNKWGMTTSNVAANIIADKILGRENKYEEIFTSTRVEPIKNRQEMGAMIKETINSFIVKKLKVPEEEKDNLQKEEGKIIEIDGEKVGAYKDENGKIYTIIPKCAHLGCELLWNSVEKTWDCPCHGSKYDYKGKMLYGPAVKDLERND